MLEPRISFTEYFHYDKYSWYTINADINKIGKRLEQPNPN
jgi:hypothetical protein